MLSNDYVLRMAKLVNAGTNKREIWPPTFRRQLDFTLEQLKKFAEAIYVDGQEAERESIIRKLLELGAIEDGDYIEAIRARDNKY